MVMYNKIIQSAINSKKNILILGSPRSGTHALGAELSGLGNYKNLGEICKSSDKPTQWNDIELLYNTNTPTIAQIVQLTAKIHLSKSIPVIRNHNIIVNIRRKNKVKQFASWVYFRLLDPTEFVSWHNHLLEETKVKQYSVEAREEDLIQFMLEQLIDDYFLPNYNLCYEDLTFTQTIYQKNEFTFPLETMFSNLDYVKTYLDNWKYSEEHFKNE